MTDTNRYPAQVFWSDEDQGFIAIAPDLPGCSAGGGTQAEALEELQHAIAAWRKAMKKAGNPVPEPPHPVTAHRGRIALRTSNTMHAQLAARAQVEGVSLNSLCNELLASGLAARSAQYFVPVMPAFLGSSFSTPVTAGTATAALEAGTWSLVVNKIDEDHPARTNNVHQLRPTG
jgi:predicted RNase H-like HicB family nuclease